MPSRRYPLVRKVSITAWRISISVELRISTAARESSVLMKPALLAQEIIAIVRKHKVTRASRERFFMGEGDLNSGSG